MEVQKKMRTIQLVTALALVATISGCASTSLRQSWGSALAAVTPGKSKQSVLQSEAVRTPLSDEFKQAQRNLKNPESLLVMHARLMEDQEKFAEARQRYREVITAYPRNVEAAVGLARVEHKTGRVEQAEQILTELQEMHPSSVPVRMALGSLYKERGQLEDAVRTYATAADLEPVLCHS
jgi:Flp pilus assembly protein TadD